MTPVTLDSNIWISAFNFRGKPRRLIEMADAGIIRIDISGAIIEEVLRVLRRKFQWSEKAVQGALEEMTSITHRVTPQRRLDFIKEDPEDNRILECAVEALSHFIVSGDNDLLRQKRVAGVRIMSVSDFISEIDERSRGR